MGRQQNRRKESVNQPNSLKNKRVLVTGGGGFLGWAVVQKLLEKGALVRSFSRRSYPQLAAAGVDQVQGDIGDPEAVAAACRGIDTVYHVAAKAGVWGRASDFHRTNVVGTRNVIAACRAGSVEALVYTSSPSVVFDGKDMEGCRRVGAVSGSLSGPLSANQGAGRKRSGYGGPERLENHCPASTPDLGSG